MPLPLYLLALTLLAACSEFKSVPDASDAATETAATDVADAGSADTATTHEVGLDTTDATDVAHEPTADTAPTVDADACGLAVCGGVCIDTQTDVRHCGVCGRDCAALPHAAPSAVRCEAGACVLPAGACVDGWADCDRDPATGCEADLSRVETCGACDTRCLEPAPVCSPVAGMTGRFACATGCDATASTRCGGSCANTVTSTIHCGRCGNPCPTPAHGRAVCNMGACGAVCDVGYHACGAICVDDTAVATCGARCEPCPPRANAVATCVAVACTFRCDDGFADCDRDATNGCEADLQNAAANCSACGVVCPAVVNGAPVCVGGVCSFRCGAGHHRCGDRCVANDSVLTCGDRCTPCELAANAVATTCDGTRCGLRCDTGFHACGGRCVPNGDVATCGTSCAPCPVPTNGRATCDGTRCGITCEAGHHPCGGVCGDDRSPATCGVSCAPCPVPIHGSATCDGARCGFRCDAGYAPSGDRCVVASPRPLTPRSCSWTTTQRPTFRWTAATGIERVRVQVCSDRACTRPVINETVPASGTYRATSALTPGAWFWRLYGVVGGVESPSPSTTWEFVVTALDTPRDTSFGLVPDYDGDGFIDVAVGSVRTNSLSVYHGAVGGLAAEPRTLSGIRHGEPAGDVNGDGYCDFLARLADREFRLYVGSPVGLRGEGSFRTGYCDVAGHALGDVDNDSYGDVSCGFAGRAHIVLGTATGTREAGPALEGLTATGAGDVNGDGWLDVVTSEHPPSLELPPSVRVYLGGAAGLATVPARVVRGRTGTIAGDGNGDGYSDLLVSDYAYVTVYLSVDGTLPATPQTTYEGARPIEFGRASIWSRDLSGDGIDDLAISDSAANVHIGQVYIVLGSRTRLSTTPAAILGPPDDRDWRFGLGMGGWGDLTGDGLGDLLVSGPSGSAPQAFLHAGVAGRGAVGSAVRAFDGGYITMLVLP